MQIGIFGLCPYTRRVTIFLKYCAYGLAAQAVELILWVHNHLYSYIDKHPSDFARIGSSSEGPSVHHCGKTAYTAESTTGSVKPSSVAQNFSVVGPSDNGSKEFKASRSNANESYVHLPLSSKICNRRSEKGGSRITGPSWTVLYSGSNLVCNYNWCLVKCS